jgi:Flp pilus assembly protein TadG
MTKRRSFRHDESGSIGTILGVSALPLLLMIGAGLDYTRASSERTQLQIGTDAAAIAGIRAVRQGVSLASAGTVMTAVIQANDLNPNAHIVNTTLSSDGTTICIDTASQIATSVMQLALIKTVAVGAHACSKMNIDTFEVAFAIDNSGSMANSANNGQTKLAAAKSAANALISALTPAGSAASLTASYSVVPFAASVNVAWGGCVEERPAPYTISDDKAVASIPDTLFVPLLYPDEQDSNYYAYNSYLADFNSSCKTGDAYYTADRASPGTGDGQTKLCKYTVTPSSSNSSNGISSSPNLSCTTTAVSPLNATVTVAQSGINAMAASGDTTLLAGFMWAWRTISPNTPFTTTNTSTTAGQQTPKVYNYVNPTTGANNHKVIILLTDGMNHWSGQANDASYAYFQNDPNNSIYNALGFFGDNRLGTTTAANARSLVDNATVQACTNAKTAGIEVYTVGFLATDGIDAAGQTVLANCATDSAHSFLAQDGTQLVTVFQTIAATLTKPRIAK